MIDIETQLRSYQHAKNIRMEIRTMTGRAADEIKRLRAVEALAKEWATAYSGNDHLRLGNAEIMLHGGVSSSPPPAKEP